MSARCAGWPDLGIAIADQPDELLRLGQRVVGVALLGHRPTHLLLARPRLPRWIGAFSWVFHGQLVKSGGRIANNDVATAHDCHPCREEDVERKTTRNGAFSCAIWVGR